MADAVSQLIVRLLDQVSGPAKKAGAALAALQAQAARGGAVGAIAKQQLAVAGAQQALAHSLADTKNKFMGAATAAGALGFATYALVKQGVQFDRQLVGIQQKLNATPETMERAKTLIKDIARDVRQSFETVGRGVDTAIGKGLDPLDNPEAVRSAAKLARTYEGIDIEDSTNLVRSMAQNMKVPDNSIPSLLDEISEKSKTGQFEIKNFAKEASKSFAIMQARGFTGAKAVGELNSMMQIAAKTSGTPDEAANDVYNLLTKADSAETRKKFKKLGVDIRKELKEGQAKGENIFDVLHRSIMKATKGDISKVGDVFQDMQAQNAARALMLFNPEMQEFIKLAKGASGVIDRDLNTKLGSLSGKLDENKSAWERMAESVTGALDGDLKRGTGILTGALNAIENLADKSPNAIRGIAGLGATLVALPLAHFGRKLLGGAMKMGLLSLAGFALRAAKPFAMLGAAMRTAAGAGAAVAGMARVGGLAGLGVGAGLLAARSAGVLRAASAFRILGGALSLLRSFTIPGALLALATMDFSTVARGWEAFKQGFSGGLSPEAASTLSAIGSAASSAASAIGNLAPTAQQCVSALQQLGAIAAAGINFALGGVEAAISAFNRVAGAARAAAGAIRAAASAAASGAGKGNSGYGVTYGAGGIPQSDPGKARGGGVASRQPYMVGESGPELFVPGTAGRILPNRGRGGGRGGNTISNSNQVAMNFYGQMDPPAVKRAVEEGLERMARSVMRGSQFDVGMTKIA